MIDLTTYSQDEVIAKGQYSIVRAAHEKSKERLAEVCGQLMSIPSQILRLAQPANGALPDGAAISKLCAEFRDVLEQAEKLAVEVEGLAGQRVTLKATAWGRRP